MTYDSASETNSVLKIPDIVARVPSGCCPIDITAVSGLSATPTTLSRKSSALDVGRC